MANKKTGGPAQLVNAGPPFQLIGVYLGHPNLLTDKVLAL
jgi:hypothetical protein